MADILAFNLTQTETQLGTFAPRKMNDPDLSTKLKLMGVDVASFGDFFADRRMREKLEAGTKAKTILAAEPASNPDMQKQQPIAEAPSGPAQKLSGNGVYQDGALKTNAAPAQPEQCDDASPRGAAAKLRKQRQHLERPDEPIKCLTYKDPFANVYKKYVATASNPVCITSCRL